MELSLEDLLKAPIVESAARRGQSLNDAPAAVTQLEADEIIGAGVVTMADILRRVPGLFVLERKAKNFDVGLRGNYRVLLLVDGRLVATTDDTPFWDGFPFHVGEIERIEVLRGAGSIVFGADGLSGVINIVTKRPLERPNTEALAATGVSVLPNQPDDAAGRRVRGLGNGYTSLVWTNKAKQLAARLTLSAGQAPEWIDLPPAAARIHGDFAFHGALGLDWRPDRDTSVFFDLRHGQNEAIQNIPGSSGPFYESHVMNSLTVNFQRLRLPGNVNLMAVADFQRVDYVDNALAPDQVTPLHTEPTLTAMHSLVQAYASQWNDRNTLSLAGEASHSIVAHALGASASTTKSAVVLQNETVLLEKPRMVLNLGSRFERVEIRMSEHPSISYVHFSPRLSVSIAPSPKHTFRAVVTNAYRTPDIFSAYLDLIDPGAYVSPVPPLYVGRANPWLKPEEVLSSELGYRGHPWRWLRIDATAYLQRLQHPISVLRASVPLYYENGPDDWQTGIELGIKTRFRKQLGAYASYAYMHTTRSTPSMGFPSNIITVGADAMWRDYRFDVDFHWYSSFESADLDVSETILKFNYRRSQSEPLLNLRVAQRILNGDAEVFLSARNIISLGHRYDSLAVIPGTWANPIGATFLLGIRIPTL